MPQAAPTLASFRFTTDELPLRERPNAVRNLRDRGLLPLEPLADHVVQVRITKCFLPGAGILSGTLGGLRQDAVAQTQGVSDDLFFAVNLTGRSIVVQRQREITLGGGNAVLVGCADGNFSVARPEPARFVGVRVPRRYLAPLIAGLDDQTMVQIPAGAQPLRLLTGYLAALGDLQDTVSPSMSRVVASHVHDLMALSLGATRDAAAAAQGSVRAVRLRAIKSDIADNIEDGMLTIAAVAARHGVTPRYIHKLFEHEGITVTQFILKLRLDRAYRMLRDERLLTRTITAIAYDVGFNDLSYFNRAFRRRFHATPSDIRAMAALGRIRDN